MGFSVNRERDYATGPDAYVHVKYTNRAGSFLSETVHYRYQGESDAAFNRRVQGQAYENALNVSMQRGNGQVNVDAFSSDYKRHIW